MGVSLHQHVGGGVKLCLQYLISLAGVFCILTGNMACSRSVGLVKPSQNALLCRFVVLVVFISVNVPGSASAGISPERCLIWGPGLNPDVVLPVRYFYIQAVNSKGENLTLSPGKHIKTIRNLAYAANVVSVKR